MQLLDAVPPQFFAGLTPDYIDLIHEILCGEPDTAAMASHPDMLVPCRWLHSPIGPYGGC